MVFFEFHQAVSAENSKDFFPVLPNLRSPRSTWGLLGKRFTSVRSKRFKCKRLAAVLDQVFGGFLGASWKVSLLTNLHVFAAWFFVATGRKK